MFFVRIIKQILVDIIFTGEKRFSVLEVFFLALSFVIVTAKREMQLPVMINEYRKKKNSPKWDMPGCDQ